MISWISVNDRLPKTHKEVDEDGKFYINGVCTDTVTHWAHINRPDGHLL